MKFIFSICLLIAIICTNNSSLGQIYLQPNNNLTNSVNQCITTQCGDYNCNSNSFCLNNQICLCNPGYTSNPFDNLDQCCYQKRKQIKAFLLEFFVSFGAGHFYAGRNGIGGAKVFLFLFCITLNIFVFGVIKCYKQAGKLWHLLSSVSLAISLSCYFLWQLIDMIMFGLNKYVDGNGVDLQAW